MRTRAVLWRIALLAAWFGALIGLQSADSDDATAYVVVGAPLTVLVGAVVNRWWVVLVPLAITVGWLAISFAVEPSCSDCWEGDPRGVAAVILGIVFTAPATAALAIGVGARRLTRFFRGLDDGPDPEPT